MSHCPHCGRPRLFANVDIASDPEEQEALNRRVKSVTERATHRGAATRVEDFKHFVDAAKPVTACAFHVVDRLSKSVHKLPTSLED